MKYRPILLVTLLATSPPATALSLLTEEWPPVSFANGKGQPEGMAVEVVKLLQERLKDSNPIQIQPWARAYNSLLNEKDVMLFTVGRNAERERLMTLLGPILISSTDVFALRQYAAEIRKLTPAAMQKLPTAAYRGSIFETTAHSRGFNVFPTNDPAHSARMLAAGRVKLWVEGNVVVGNVLREQGLPLATVERVATLDRLSLYLAFSPNVPRDTILRWEKALNEIKQDGSFATIHQHWFPQDPVPLQVERLGIQR
ncbi:transporter substrate-binding domain-containing protein [Vogesella sp. DC21W]|uniref:Transporter substrate-binding domain-containing protein n=1 Tax=Vogesella aquatica TaxID=2984206 RepID=A0ABT5IZ16_9NEIS|nr:transporter substrate-binding domain-containing protein [Vogesella aquatica]MDC7717825.1 transporter substrate-binding domain-containing protein [Vogesella aquatica]